ncbi:MAG: TetR/AcrR family transcriptional regulator [Acidimicrobiia bacterium]
MPDTWQESLSDHKLRQAEHIVHAAMALVFERGVPALSMSALARAAGISRQTLYKYFPDVASVLRAAVRGSEHSTAGIEAEETPVEQLTAFVRYVLSAAAAGHPSPASLAPVLAPDVRTEMDAHSAQIRGLVAAILQRGKKEGVFRGDLAPDLDGDIVYWTVMGLSDQVAGATDTGLLTSRIERAVLSMVGFDG